MLVKLATFSATLENVNGPIGPCNIAKEETNWGILGGRYIC
jgi:hypothetical protein